MRISRKLAALAAFFVIAVAVSACGGSSVPGNSVASVAGNPITLQAFNHWMYISAKQQAAQAAQQGETAPVIVANDPPKFASCIKQVKADIPQLAASSTSTLRKDCNQVFQQFTTQVMAYLVEAYWYQADAHKLGITYSQAQLMKDFNKEKKSVSKAQYQEYLKSNGMTQADLLWEIRVSKLYGKLIKRYEKPSSAAAISAYYDKHKSEFGSQESRDVHLVRTKTQSEAQAAYNALKSGTSWNAVAKQYAEDASAKANGGVLQGITPNEEEHAVNQAIFNNPANKLVGPVKGIFGYYVVEVTKVTPAKQESLTKATPTIKQLLTSQEQQSAQKKITALSKKNWHKQTICRKLYSVTDCFGYKAPKPPATPTAPASTTPSSDTGTGTSGAATTTGTTPTATTASTATGTTTTGS